MSKTETIRVTWVVDIEVPQGTGDREVAQEVAETYFQDRIAGGQADTACIFTVQREGVTTLVDLSKQQTEVRILAWAAKKGLDAKEEES